MRATLQTVSKDGNSCRVSEGDGHEAGKRLTMNKQQLLENTLDHTIYAAPDKAGRVTLGRRCGFSWRAFQPRLYYCGMWSALCQRTSTAEEHKRVVMLYMFAIVHGGLQYAENLVLC